MRYDPSSTSDRSKAAVGAILLQAALGYALITGLSVRMPEMISERLKLFAVTPEPPPPERRPTPKRDEESRPRDEAAPPNLRSQASPVVASEPVVPLLLPPPVIAAPRPAEGSDRSAGAADVPGPGTGAGGVGDGLGGGGYGDGDGDGYGSGTPPRLLRGRIRDSDYPSGVGEAGTGGVVSVRYTVAVSGRVTRCSVDRSSGSAVLDDTTCRLIMQRFRFEPSFDERGRPVQSVIVQDHYWHVEDEPEEYRE